MCCDDGGHYLTAHRGSAPPDLPGEPAAQPFVEFNRVWLAYNDELARQGEFAIEDISLQVEPGEFIAIVGPSGCGKSTFMKLATGLKPATRGVVKIAGEKVAGPLKMVGMAFQAPTLLPWRTTLQNVMLPLEIVEPYRSTLRQKRMSTRRAHASCCAPWAWPATRTSTRGSSPAACSSVPRSAAR